MNNTDRQTEALEALVKYIDLLGLNYKQPEGRPGAIEKVAMELEGIKKTLWTIADHLHPDNPRWGE